MMGLGTLYFSASRLATDGAAMSELRIPAPDPSQLFDRLPPHSIEAEMCLIGAMMLDKHIIGDIVSLVDRESFYREDHQILFELLISLYQSNRAIDAIVVREELIKAGRLDEIGGTSYLGQLLNAVPSAAHAAHYGRIVR